MDQPLLRLENLQIAYPQMGSVWAVDRVSLQLQAGDCLGLVGESGCGKSTLGRAILRLLPNGSQVNGEIYFEGQSLFSLAPKALQQFRGEAVGLIFQDPMTRLDPLMTIGDHCIKTLKAHRPDLSHRQVKARVLETLETVNISAQRWQQYPHEFSGGMRQRVAIALALLLNPKLIVADEPTTSLDVTVSAQILQELTRLCQERKMGLLLISHDLALVGKYCDRIAVMYQGKLVETGPTQSILKSPQHSYSRSLLQAALHLHGSSGEENSEFRTPNSLLRLQNVKQHYTLERNFIEQFLSGDSLTIKAVDDISFELQTGETLGLVGESGCGKSTLCRTILQLIRPTGGQIQFLGQELTSLSRRTLRQQRHQMQMIFQDPHACLNPLMTIGQSIADPLLIHKLALTPTQAKPQVDKMLDRVGLNPTEFYDRYPHELSGGQQQRVGIARALITHPQLLICDEPVSMLDATVQAQVLDLMLALKQEFALTYLFVTHDLGVARFFCDRIAVMTAGKIVEMGPTQQIFQDPQHPYTQSLLQAAPVLGKF
jgi:peptide/nickel transport system ATP-binding protein